MEGCTFQVAKNFRHGGEIKNRRAPIHKDRFANIAVTKLKSSREVSLANGLFRNKYKYTTSDESELLSPSVWSKHTILRTPHDFSILITPTDRPPPLCELIPSGKRH